MATISGGACNHAHIDLIVSESKVSTSGNTSTVSWKLVGYLDTASSNYWYSNNYHTISVKINGATVYSKEYQHRNKSHTVITVNDSIRYCSGSSQQ